MPGPSTPSSGDLRKALGSRDGNAVLFRGTAVPSLSWGAGWLGSVCASLGLVEKKTTSGCSRETADLTRGRCRRVLRAEAIRRSPRPQSLSYKTTKTIAHQRLQHVFRGQTQASTWRAESRKRDECEERCRWFQAIHCSKTKWSSVNGRPVRMDAERQATRVSVRKEDNERNATEND
ncbi:hypothetical protein VTI28DRAFT_3239 [Corynascus sepedonium]